MRPRRPAAAAGRQRARARRADDPGGRAECGSGDATRSRSPAACVADRATRVHSLPGGRATRLAAGDTIRPGTTASAGASRAGAATPTARNRPRRWQRPRSSHARALFFVPTTRKRTAPTPTRCGFGSACAPTGAAAATSALTDARPRRGARPVPAGAAPRTAGAATASLMVKRTGRGELRVCQLSGSSSVRRADGGAEGGGRGGRAALRRRRLRRRRPPRRVRPPRIPRRRYERAPPPVRPRARRSVAVVD